MMMVGRLIAKRLAFSQSSHASALYSTRAALQNVRSGLIPRMRFLGVVSVSQIPRNQIEPYGNSTVRGLSDMPPDRVPNWSNRPPPESAVQDGCDYEHWFVVMEPPQGNPTRDEIIDTYIKTLAQVVGSEEEARMKIYSVSTKHYYAFGCNVSEELSHKLNPLPNVSWVLPDSYVDYKTKSYGGEPFINGQAVPYDPKYHEEWVRNNARCNERRSSDRLRNSDRSSNFERRREMRRNAYQQPPPSNNYQYSQGNTVQATSDSQGQGN